MIPLNPPFKASRPLKVHEKDLEGYLARGYTKVEPKRRPGRPKKTDQDNTEE